MKKYYNIPWYEWLYNISRCWVVISLSRRVFGWKWYYVIKERILKSSKHTHWYVNFVLHKNWKPKIITQHRLLMLVFNWESKWRDVNHINWIKDDNRLENLEYCTRSENMIHAYNIWLKKPAYKSCNQYSLSGEFIKKWNSISEAEISLWITSVSSCCSGRCKTTWWYIFKY